VVQVCAAQGNLGLAIVKQGFGEHRIAEGLCKSAATPEYLGLAIMVLGFGSMSALLH
jgi:hypothetical protein